MTTPRITFHALPRCPHLTYSFCGYSLLSFAGLPAVVRADEVEMITINGASMDFRPMSDTVVMLTPGIPLLEAQAIRVYCKEPQEAPRGYATVQAGVAPPAPVYGFTAPSGPYREAL